MKRLINENLVKKVLFNNLEFLIWNCLVWFLRGLRFNGLRICEELMERLVNARLVKESCER
jgi:hypothetical protein